MNLLSSEALAEELAQLWGAGGIEVFEKDPISVDWDRWEDPGDYPNDLADRSLAPGPWKISNVAGSARAVFAVPKEWVCERDGRCWFLFDDEDPAEIVGFLHEAGLVSGITELARDLARVRMSPPEGRVDQSLDGFVIAPGAVTLKPKVMEMEISIEITMERID